MRGRFGISACVLLLVLLPSHDASAQALGRPGQPVPPRTQNTNENTAPVRLPTSPDEWTADHLKEAVRRRHGRLPEALAARARTEDAVQFAALIRELLETAASPDDAAPAGQKPGRPATRNQTAPSIAQQQRAAGSDIEKGRGLRLNIAAARLAGPKQPNDSGESPPHPDASEQNAGDGDLTDEDLVRACIQGLLINDSDPAWQTLESILMNMQTTPLDPSENARAVIEELFSRPSLNPLMAESLLIAVVEAGKPAVDSLNVLTALSEHINRASFGLLNSDGDPVEAEDPSQQPSVGAPLVLGRGQRLLLRNRNERNGPKPGRQKSTGEETSPPAGPRVVIPLNRTEQAAAVVRGTDLSRTVAEHVMADDWPTLLRFAATLPRAEVRHAVFVRLSASQESGADHLLSAGLFGPLMNDPGILIVLKSLPRSSPRRSRHRADEAESPDDSWQQATWQTVNALRHHLRKASAKAAFRYDGTPPLRLHRGAKAETVIRIVIPDGSPPRNDQAGSVEVYYSRCRVTPTTRAEMNRIARHYEKRTRGVRHEMREDGVLWFDGFRRGRDGTRMSRDVLVERASTASGGGTAAPGQTFTIETITVVAADPEQAVTPGEQDVSRNHREPRQFRRRTVRTAAAAP